MIVIDERISSQYYVLIEPVGGMIYDMLFNRMPKIDHS